MSFTYDLSTNIGKLRLELGDTVSGTGVRPNGTNLSDEELQILLTRESDSVMQATAAACELLARQWATTASLSIGPRSEQLGKVADNWAARGKELRAQYGGAGSGYGFSASFARDDGYADNDATEYT